MLPLFIFHTFKSIRQSKKAKGLVHASFRNEGWLTYWTLTVWEDEASMKEYRNKGNHLKAMKVSRKIADQLEKLNWEDDHIPDWQECMELLHNHYHRDVKSV
jgi:heme-degrading monooxygenase HmoA